MHDWSYFWLSFIDPSKPKGQKSLGVAIVKAVMPADAILESHRLGCNPGGEVEIYRVPGHTLPNPVEPWLNRVIQRAELKEAGLID